ncbi:MAG: hypothetical protein H5T64_07660 [Chloroflexi bacterium]|nr:hypothetical protein [Chloroflexota bacterium]
MFKLLLTWDVKPGQEQEYIKFLTQELAPKVIALGLQLTDAWYNMYGDGPQVMAGGITEDLAAMQEILSNPEWEELEAKLLTFVDNYRRRVVETTGGFQL